MINLFKFMIASILINSKNVENLKKVFDSYESNASNPSSFEIIVNINKESTDIKNFLEDQIIKRNFKLKYIDEYEGDYFSGHINNNKMLNYVSEDTYFISCTGDRVLVKTKNWDKKLEKYKNFFKDDFFRVKCSSFRHRKYFDIWECCFAPSNITFTTLKLIKIIGDLSPCFSHDSFQQCLFFYLESHDNFNSKQINRDLAINSLEFSGDTPEVKNDEENYERINGQLISWNILTSAKIQKEAFRRSMLVKANIFYGNKTNEYDIYDENNNICIRHKSSRDIIKYNYNVNIIKIYVKNLFRKYSYLNYCGGGLKESPNKTIFSIIWYLNFRYECLRGIKDLYNKYFG